MTRAPRSGPYRRTTRRVTPSTASACPQGQAPVTDGDLVAAPGRLVPIVEHIQMDDGSRRRRGNLMDRNSADAPDHIASVTEALDAHVAAFESHRGNLYGLQGWGGLQILDRVEVTSSRWHEEPFPVLQHHALTLKYLSGSREEGWNDPDRPFVLVTTTDETE